MGSTSRLRIRRLLRYRSVRLYCKCIASDPPLTHFRRPAKSPCNFADSLNNTRLCYLDMSQNMFGCIDVQINRVLAAIYPIVLDRNYVINMREHQLKAERDCWQFEIRLLSVILGRQRKRSLRGVTAARAGLQTIDRLRRF